MTMISEKARQARSRQTEGPTARQTFVVNLEHGLHARPCALMVKTLLPFRSRVEVEANGERASGRSIMGLMALAAGFGCSITFTLTGEDAHPGLEAVRRLFATHFADAYRASPEPARSPSP
jgi:phosphotransferase system HPr (HPr) family protein